MIEHWIVATLIGSCLGLAFYGCVRLRMFVGPRLGKRYGNPVRLTYWVFTILLMVVLANIALWSLRAFLNDPTPPENSLLLEIWFAALALIVGMGLIFRRFRGNGAN